MRKLYQWNLKTKERGIRRIDFTTKGKVLSAFCCFYYVIILYMQKISKKEAVVLSKLFIDEFLSKEKWYQDESTPHHANSY